MARYSRNAVLRGRQKTLQALQAVRGAIRIRQVALVKGLLQNVQANRERPELQLVLVVFRLKPLSQQSIAIIEVSL
jgi:hypothetical protein